jgi:hypothetical protein
MSADPRRALRDRSDPRGRNVGKAASNSSTDQGGGKRRVSSKAKSIGTMSTKCWYRRDCSGTSGIRERRLSMLPAQLDSARRVYRQGIWRSTQWTPVLEAENGRQNGPNFRFITHSCEHRVPSERGLWANRRTPRPKWSRAFGSDSLPPEHRKVRGGAPQCKRLRSGSKSSECPGTRSALLTMISTSRSLVT